jgi:hypothetical protein
MYFWGLVMLQTTLKTSRPILFLVGDLPQHSLLWEMTYLVGVGTMNQLNHAHHLLKKLNLFIETDVLHD